MQSLSPPATTAQYADAVPPARDTRVIGFVCVIAALAASLNIAYGGPLVAIAAFVLLLTAGIGAHVHGERKLRRLTTTLITAWEAAGAEIDGVHKPKTGFSTQTQWIIQTPDGDVTVSGLALAPFSRLAIEWHGICDTTPASRAEDNLERLAAELYAEIFVSG